MAKRRTKRTSKKNQKAKVALLVFILVVVLIVIVMMQVSPDFKAAVNNFIASLQQPEEPDDPHQPITPTPGTGKADGDLVINFIDIGQGDCMIIQFPDGKNMIIDAGDRRKANFTDIIQPYASALGIEVFDYLMLTHSDADHVGGMVSVLEAYEVKCIYRPNVNREQVDTVTYGAFLDAVEAEKALGATDVLTIAGLSIVDAVNQSYRIDIYLPTQAMYDELPSSGLDSHEKNGISPVMILQYGGKKVMFTGDANEWTEERFCELFELGLYNEEDFNVDVLKVAHHGSHEACTVPFLEIVDPEYAVIQVGEGNSYDHPRDVTLKRLAADDSGEELKFSNYDGATVYRNDLHGDIVLTLRAGENGEVEMIFDLEKGETDPVNTMWVFEDSARQFAFVRKESFAFAA